MNEDRVSRFLRLKKQIKKEQKPKLVVIDKSKTSFLDQKVDEDFLNDFNNDFNSFFSTEFNLDVSDEDIQKRLKVIEKSLSEKYGRPPSNNELLRELAIQSNPLDDIADYKNLPWDPETGINENRSLIPKYFSKIHPTKMLNNFAIEKVKSGEGPAIICLNGFLCEDTTESSTWQTQIEETRYSNNPIYVVNWESHDLLEQFRKFVFEVIDLNCKFKGDALEASLSALKSILWIIPSWYKALVTAKYVGKRLSYLLQCTKTENGYILMGHSLGARVIYYTLIDLYNYKCNVVKEAYLFGGAVGRSNADKSWSKAGSATEGRIFNFYSRNDKVLSILYMLSMLDIDTEKNYEKHVILLRKILDDMDFEIGSKPIGLRPIKEEPKINNIDVSKVIQGHSEYKNCLDDMIKDFT